MEPANEVRAAGVQSRPPSMSKLASGEHSMPDNDCTTDEGIRYAAIPRFPGYRFGDDGSGWSCRKRRTGRIDETRWRRMNPTTNEGGYLVVDLYSGGGRAKQFKLHRLILEAFVGPCPDGMEGCHSPDHTRTNCRLGNLRWGTKQDNADDRIAMGRTPKGSRHSRAKLSEGDIPEIFRLRSEGWSGQAIAEKFGMSGVTICNVLARRIWRHVPIPPEYLPRKVTA